MPDEMMERLYKARDKAEKFRKESVKWRARCSEQRKQTAALEAKIKRLEESHGR